LQGEARRVVIADHGIVRRGFDTRQPYTAWAVASPPPISLSEEERFL
jgi:hypothetical protein